MVDYALRRRFSFNRLPPAFGTSKFSRFLRNDMSVPDELVKKINDRFSALNEDIRAEPTLAGFEIVTANAGVETFGKLVRWKSRILDTKEFVPESCWPGYVCGHDQDLI